MATQPLRAFLDVMVVLKPALTTPGYRNALVVPVGWVLTSETHAVTQVLVVTGVARRRHREAFHRLFSRGTWSPEVVGSHILDRPRPPRRCRPARGCSSER